LLPPRWRMGDDSGKEDRGGRDLSALHDPAFDERGPGQSR
jgi:hypothetical protein